MTMGEKMKLLRIKRNIEVKDLAEGLGISQGYLYKILNDKIKNPAPEILNRMAEIFNVDVSELMDFDEEVIYYDEPEIFDNMPKDLQRFITDSENKPYLILAKQLKAYDLSKITEHELAFLVDWLKMAVEKNNK